MRTKQWLIVILSGLLIFTSYPLNTPAAESTDEEQGSGKYSTKDEVIYGNLDASGNIKDMYVVNSFHVTKPGEIVDYGKYTDVRNLTDLSGIERNEDEIHLQANEEEFYYQGKLDNESLPWDISITYVLDGKKVSAEELAGESGDFEIQIKTSANKRIDPLFFKNYILQISLTLDPLIFTDIQAPEGTEANEGKNKQISFMVMPDQEEELILSANVTDLEMDPINITAIPANIAIEDPDISNMTGDMESLADAIREVNSGVAELSSGISELNSGAQELSNGSKDFHNGMNELNQSSGELVSGSKEIRNALQQVSGAMQASPDKPDMGELKELPKGFRDMAKGLRESADGLGTLSKNYNGAYSALDEAINGIPNSNISEKQIEELYESGANPEVVKQLVDTYAAAQAVKQTYAQVKEAFGAVSSTLEQVSSPLYEMANHLETMADGMESGMNDLEQLDALAELQNGLATLSSEYDAFHNGLVDYTEGVNTLATSYQELDAGLQELSEGTSSLDSGVSELHEGTKELQDATSDLPDEMQSKIDELMEEYDNPDFEPASFVSEKNENVDVVQFVLKTESIEMEEVEEAEEEEEEAKGIWDRLMDLFR